MRIGNLTLAIVLLAGCSAERAAIDGANSAPVAAPAPITPPADIHGPPAADMPSPGTGDTVAPQFHGSFASDATTCADAAHESRLTIESTRIAFHESSGPITRVAQGQNEISITVQLTGEGEAREAKYTFRLSGDGRTLTDVGNGGTRERCD